MSNFSVLFPSYSSSAAYMAARDSLLESAENSYLKSGTTGAGVYGYKNAYTIGYGYDISQQLTGQGIINDFSAASITLSSALSNLLSNYQNGTGHDSTTLSQLNAQFGTDFGTTGLTSAQAISLMDASLAATYDPRLTSVVNSDGATAGGFTLGNDALHSLLLSETYNGVFGAIQAGDILNDNVTAFLDNVLFFNNTQTVGGVSSYVQGLENRHIEDLATSLGLTYTDNGNAGGNYIVTGINFASNFYAALDIADAITENYSTIPSNLTTFATNLMQGAEPVLVSQGYYVVQAVDVGSTAADTANNIVTNNSLSITGSELFRLNSTLDGAFTTGGLLFLPVSTNVAVLPSSLTGNEALVFDTNFDGSNEEQTYVVGSSLADGPAAAGTLNVIDNSGQLALTVQQSAWASTSSYLYQTVGGVLELYGFTINGTNGSTTTIVDSTGNAAIVGTNANGQTLTGGAGTDTVTAGTGTGDMLYAGTGANTLIAGNGGDHLYDGLGIDTLTGGTGNDTFTVAHATSGTSVTGGGGSDTFVADGVFDITGVSVSGVATLDDESSSLTLTSSQFSAFTTLMNTSGAAETLVIVGSGSYSLTGKTVTGSFNLITDSGTTITGNNSNGQVLYANSTGTSAAYAGNGTGDVLYAGAGNATLHAGSGGDILYDGTGTATLDSGSGADTFYVTNPLGGTTVSGGSGDTVYVSGNTGSGTSTDTITMSGGTLYVGADAYADIYGSDNTIITSSDSAVGSHNGDDNTVSEGSGSGVYLLDNGGDTVDAGAGDYVFVSGNGTSSTDNYVNISGGSVDIETETQTDIYGSGNTITTGSNSTVGVQSGIDNTVAEGNSSGLWLIDNGGSTVNAGSSDYVFVSGNGTSDADNVVNIASGSVGIDDDTQTDIVGSGNTISAGEDSLVGATGSTNSITLGSGTDLWVNSGTGNTVMASSYNTITSGTGVGVTTDGGGNDSYQFAATFASSDVIDNNYSGGLTAANGTIGFGSGVSDQSLWFQKSGNDLFIELLGTTDKITVDNWFGTNAGAEVSSLTAGGSTLDTTASAFGNLVSEMATYQSAHTGFNVQTATSMPTDSVLQGDITAAW